MASGRRGAWDLAALGSAGALGSALLFGGCGPEAPDEGAESATALGASIGESPEARHTIAALRGRYARIGPSSARAIEARGAELSVELAPSAGRAPPRVTLAAEGAPSWRLSDEASKLAVAVSLENGENARAEIADGVIAYRNAAPGGGALVVRPIDDGVEDFVELADPGQDRVAYRLELSNVGGLRLVEGTLELLDATGDPRLRVVAPEVIDADGATHATELALDGCAVDESPADPWARPVTPPGAESCKLSVTWNARAARYPVLVDPAWTATGALSSPRIGHSAVRYGSGSTERVLICGGRSNSTTYLASAQLYNPATNSWAATGSMPQAKAYFTLNVFGSNDEPHAVGGQTANTPAFTGSNYRYSPATGTWTTRTAMPTARAFHAAHATALLWPIQTLYVFGGTNDTTSPYSPLVTHERYNADTNTWTTLTSMGTARMRHTVFEGGTLNARVAQVAGGASSCTSSCTAIASSERYDVNSGTWSGGGTMPSAISDAVYSVGGVVVGSSASTVRWTGGSAWSALPNLAQALTRPAASAITGGRVIAAGGPTDAFKFDGTSWLNAGHPTTGLPLPGVLPTFSESTATLLGSGAVLFAGGLHQDGSYSSAAYLFTEVAQGEVCGQPGQCATNHCVDGYCCNTACGSPCQACSTAKKGQGSNGLCGPVVDGSDPDSDCPDDGSATCDRDGMCDGAGACRLYAQGTTCQTSSCSSEQLTTYTCNGGGSCLSSTAGCNGYACQGATACYTTCTLNTHCASTHYCAAGGTCQPKLGTGAACTGAAQCASNSCVDSVCCDTACTGLCQACSAAKKGAGGGPDGTCGPVVNGTDPDGNCPDDGSASCDRDGQCDGAGACRLYSAGVPCGTTQCVGNSTTGQICNGSGLCVNDTSGTDCTPYLCQSGACTNPCITDASCVPGNYCDAGTCKPKLANGQTCSSASQCTSNLCVDGFCCNTACSGLCQACSAAKKGAGQNGECGPVVSGQDPDNDCAVVGQCGQDGSCDGSGACKLQASGVACGSPVCVGNNVTPQQCNGLGSCVNGSSGTACSPYVCQSGACATPCATDAHCVSGFFCDAGTCAAKLPNGTSCTAQNQCSSGLCVDSVCCNAACGGLCQACSTLKKGGGVNGECGPVLSGLDPDNDCSVGAQCGTDGTCNGSGACALTAAGVPCGTTQCVGNNATGQICTGTGACVNDSVGTDCTPHICSGGSCANPCSSDAQCVGGHYCTSTGACEPKKTQGTSCGANNECTTGFCVDGVCCSSQCSSPCQACSAALKESGVDGDCGPAKNGLDPHNDCPDDGALSCQRDGQCNGAGQCRLYPQGVACGATSCVGNTVKGKICNGIGACITEATGVDCVPYLCLAGGCATTCQTNSECLGDNWCDGGLCAPKGAAGASCTAAVECTSGFCVDGVCCDAVCNGQCEACDVAGSVGQCTTVPSGQPHGSRPACAGTGACQGQCDGTDPTKCTLPDTATECAPASCTGDVSQPAGTCDGTGACSVPTTQACLPYGCDATSGDCKATCVSDTDCAQGAKCNTTTGNCAVTSATCKDEHTVVQPNGQEQSCEPYKCSGGACLESCTNDGDCASGFECDAPTCVATSTDAGGGSGGTGGATSDAGPDSGGAPASSGGGDEGGCGCRLPGRAPARDVHALWLAAVALLAARARRRRSYVAPP